MVSDLLACRKRDWFLDKSAAGRPAMTTFFDGSPRLTLEPRLLDCPSCGHDHSVKSRDVSEGDYPQARWLLERLPEAIAFAEGRALDAVEEK